MKHRIIGIAGPASVGKDTAADIMIREKPYYNKISFADPLKNMLRVGLKLSNAQLYGSEKEIIDYRYGKTPRQLMQTLGTEWGRNMINQNIWVQCIESLIVARENALNYYIIPDVRFESEADMIRRLGGIVLIIKGKNVIKSNHVSEQGIYGHPKDITILNFGTLEQFKSTIQGFIKEEL